MFYTAVSVLLILQQHIRALSAFKALFAFYEKSYTGINLEFLIDRNVVTVTIVEYV